MATDPKLFDDVCIISRHGVCLLDMKQVSAKAQQLGLTRLAEVIESDLQQNRITTGQYYPILRELLA